MIHVKGLARRGDTYAGCRTCGFGLDTASSALRISGRSAAGNQLDLQSRRAVDRFGGGLAAAAAAAPVWHRGLLRPGAGPGELQYHFEASGGPPPALCSEHSGGAADGAAPGRVVSLGPYGGILCGSVRPQDRRQSPVEARAGCGGGDRIFPAVPVCPLAQRRAGRRPAGSRRGLGRGQACGKSAEEKRGAKRLRASLIP